MTTMKQKKYISAESLTRSPAASRVIKESMEEPHDGTHKKIPEISHGIIH